MDIYAPEQNAPQFKMGCQIDARCIVRDPNGYCYDPWTDCVEVYVDDFWYAGNCDLVDWDPGNTWAKFKVSENDGGFVDTWWFWPGPHKITMEFHRAPQDPPHASADRNFNLFGMIWPEDGIVGCDCQCHIDRPSKCGWDIFFSKPALQPGGVNTKNPIWQAHAGQLDDKEVYDSRGGWRFWVYLHQKVRLGFLTDQPDGIPKYDEKYVFTYYAHQVDYKVHQEDTSGNAAGGDSHLHFGVFVNDTDLNAPNTPPYNNEHAQDPWGWVVPNPAKPLNGRVRKADSTGIGGVQVRISTRGYATTPSSGYYECYVQRGSYTVTPVKENWTFTPPSAAVTVGDYGASQDFIGTPQ